MEQSESNVYELGFHLVPTVAADDLAKEVADLKEILAKHQASFIAEEFPRTLKLAYRMEKSMGGKLNKYTSAYFGWVKFEAPRSELPALKKELDASKTLLRYLLIKTVRENTYLGPKFGKKVGAEKDAEATDDAEPKPEVNQEELDKTIDNLVVA
jgi:ribosomal protein S6